MTSRKMSFSHLIFAVILYDYCVVIEGAVKSRDSNGYVWFPNVQGGLKLHSTEASWRDAHRTCYNEGAILASPENEALLFAMSDTLWANYNTPPQVFTGIHDTFSKGHFFSLEGSPLDELPVPGASDEASLDLDESCLSMYHNGKLATSTCNYKRPFFCFKRDRSASATYDNRLNDCGSDKGYTLDTSTGSCYKFHKEYVYWRNAFATCANEGAHLAIINSRTESDVLKKLFENNKFGRSQDGHHYENVAHIGFVNWGTHESPLWMTIHGQTLTNAGFDKWDGAEPNNRNDQRCGGMFLNGELDDVNCLDGDPDKGTRSFICEKKPKLAPDATSEN